MADFPEEKPYIIPLFIPHLGCPHQCVFCNQQAISGRSRTDQLTASAITAEIDRWLAWKKADCRPVELAFFGGSFTALPHEEQRRMLVAAKPYLDSGRIGSIRLSTRPDAIDEKICGLLQVHGVRTVELGVQSLDEEVLRLSGRGHGPEDVEKAFVILRRFSLEIGAQLMLGLPGDSRAKAVAGAERLAGLGPRFVRIYPTSVVRESPLAAMYQAGCYRPLTLGRAIVSAVRVKEVFDRYRIRVIRMGLQDARTLNGEIVAGPHHAAFGELVLSRQYYLRLRRLLAGRPSRPHVLAVSAKDQSVLRGLNNRNWHHLNDQGLLDNVRVHFNAGLERNDMRLTECAT